MPARLRIVLWASLWLSACAAEHVPATAVQTAISPCQLARGRHRNEMSLLARLARRVMFPRHLVQMPPPQQILGLERWWLDAGSDDGKPAKVEVWFMPGRNVTHDQPGPAVIFTHGNGEVIDHWPLELSHYTELGVSVVLPEYRGYGRSGGKPSQENLVADLCNVLAHLKSDKRVDMRKLIFHGRSIGGGVACALAKLHPPKALILESTFSTMLELTRAMRIPSFLVHDTFESLPVVRAFQGPILIMHGTQDSLIPKQHGEQLAASNPRAKLVLYRAGHNDLPRAADYWGHIEKIVEQVRAD